MLDKEDKKLVGAYFGNYAKHIVLTLESILSDLGAETSPIQENSDILSFSNKGRASAIDLQNLFLHIFCCQRNNIWEADQSLISEEKVLHKALSVIEEFLKEA